MKVLITAPPRNWMLDNSDNPKNVDMDTIKKIAVPSLSIYLLSSIIRENGHSVTLLDPMSYAVEVPNDSLDLHKMHEMLFPILEKQIMDVDIVSVSTTSFDWLIVKNLMERIKLQDPDLPIILGGVHATFADEYILKNSKVDFVVRREGEKTLPELLNALEKDRPLNNILGITYPSPNNGNITRNKERQPLTIHEMETTPYPAFDLMPNNVYSCIGVETSRGCKFSCVFCSIPFRNLWRGLNPEIVQKRVEHALDYTNKLYGNESEINLVDETFTADRKRAEQILYNFSKTDFGKASLFFEARINDLLNSNIFEVCKKVPLKLIQIGIESGYDEGLKTIRKGTTTHMVEKCASIANAHGISEYLFYSFIIGFPWESKEECLKTVDFVYNLVSKYGGNANINWLQLFPGSYLWNNRDSYGINYGLELYDSHYWTSKEFRLKLSSKLKEEDFIDIKKRANQNTVSLLLRSHKGFVNCIPHYLEDLKIINY